MSDALSFLVEGILLKGKTETEIYPILKSKWPEARGKNSGLPEKYPAYATVQKAIRDCHKRWKLDAGTNDIVIARELRILHDLYGKNIGLNDYKAALVVQNQIVELRKTYEFIDQRSKITGRPIKGIRNCDLPLIEELAKIQCTDVEIAAALRINPDTLYQRFKDTPGFSDKIKRARLGGHQSLRRMQFKLAQEGNPTMLVWLGKNVLGQTDRQEVKMSGDTDKPLKIEIVGAEQPTKI